jgi:hypothetical protein
VVIKDNELARTSAWANTFLGRDHVAQQHERQATGESGKEPSA